ncbi:MAG TPA: diguanylate cyclase [Candidatus Limnocylindria bacterium]|nr:diguanylate cyclase [Candidatus Limnocylindria bacterium]
MRHARWSTIRASRAPRLLVLVFGIFLVLVGITASALVAVTSDHLARTTLNAVVGRDRSLVDLFANENLLLADLTEPMTPARRAELDAALESLADDDGIEAIEIHTADGALLTTGAGADAQTATRLAEALAGDPSAELVGAALLAYLPLKTEAGDVVGAVVIQRPSAPLLAGLDAARRDVVVITVAAALALATVLVLVFRAAHVRLVRQGRQLAEAARRDALTGLLNHGSSVALLTERLEGDWAGRPVAVALVDVDGFRLFNDTHGHDAGDVVLLRVAEIVTDAAGPDGVAGRYGPDEFIVIRPGLDAAACFEALADLQAAIRAIAVRVEGAEPLPVTVSIGIAAVPSHATSVTPLLAEASVALAEAGSSGGDVAVVARIGEEKLGHAGSFDVLQGLVLAVDTKDRYTKRHSEDVARYAVYLGRRLGLDGHLLEPIRLGGLLHDIGKIGIPDRLLRKPSSLTEAEIKVFNQHVALGEAILNGIPHLEDVRAAVRHHHERWDGGGYLDRLAGEDIPLIARIIAVADTFSAMTTTRPYRRALSVEEALRRLRGAAGSQLQPELVETFASGIERDPDAPMPNEVSDVWQPLRVA